MKYNYDLYGICPFVPVSTNDKDWNLLFQFLEHYLPGFRLNKDKQKQNNIEYEIWSIEYDFNDLIEEITK